MPSSEIDAGGLEIRRQRVESSQLLRVERLVFRERHHRASDLDRLPRREIANERRGIPERHPHATDSCIDADMQRHALTQTRRCLGNRVADRCVDHRHDLPRDDVVELARVERPQQQHRFANAGIAQRHGLVQLDDGEAGNRRERLEDLRDVDDTGAVAVVLDHRENGPTGTAVHLSGVVPEVRRIDFNPWIEGRIANGRRGHRASPGPSDHRRKGRGFEECAT